MRFPLLLAPLSLILPFCFTFSSPNVSAFSYLQSKYRSPLLRCTAARMAQSKSDSNGGPYFFFRDFYILNILWRLLSPARVFPFNFSTFSLRLREFPDGLSFFSDWLVFLRPENLFPPLSIPPSPYEAPGFSSLPCFPCSRSPGQSQPCPRFNFIFSFGPLIIIADESLWVFPI